MKLTNEEIKRITEESQQQIEKLQNLIKEINEIQVEKPYITGFERKKEREEYCFLNENEEIVVYREGGGEMDDKLFKIVNYGDEILMNLIAKKQLLFRQMFKFSAENGGYEIKSNTPRTIAVRKGEVNVCICTLYEPDKVYFKTSEVAEKAVEKFGPTILEIYELEKEVAAHYRKLNSDSIDEEIEDEEE